MSQIITPEEIRAAADTDHKPFLSLLSNEEELRTVAEGLENAVLRSFGEDVRVNPYREHKITRNEIKHRYRICIAWIRHARGDLGMSMERTLDLMPQALRCELDGVAFEPRTTGVWTP